VPLRLNPRSALGAVHGRFMRAVTYKCTMPQNKAAKNVVTSTSEMCIGSLEKIDLVQSKDNCCFQESRVAKQCLDAAKFTGRQYIYYRWYILPLWLHSPN
jgi:hypothetical protein